MSDERNRTIKQTEDDDEPDVEAHRKTVSRDDSEPGEGDRGRKQL